MIQSKLIRITAAGLLLATCQSTRATDYIANVLYQVTLPTTPSYGNITGVSGGQVVGNVTFSSTPSSSDLLPYVWAGPGMPNQLTGPANFSSLTVEATNGTQQGGYGFDPTLNDYHALFWNGSLSDPIDLNPTGFGHTILQGMDSTQQVGWGVDLIHGGVNALLWSGTAGSAVPLYAAGDTSTEALAVAGNEQVGWGRLSEMHAMLWKGSTASAIDLNPSFDLESYAMGTSGSQEVGQGSPDGTTWDALLWNGSASSVVDLGIPIGFTQTTAVATNGTQQVGTAFGNTENDAVVWSGSASSMVDLQSFLPANMNDSTAYAIDSTGNIYGLAFGQDSTYAVEWTPVPEPFGIWLVAMTSIAVVHRSPHRRMRDS